MNAHMCVPVFPAPAPSVGTAGLRGRMGAGTARMNTLVVQQTSQGLAAHLKAHADPTQLANGVVIGKLFAKES